jgi:hypothetical protein
MAAVLQLEPRYFDPEDGEYEALPQRPVQRLRLIEPDRQYRPRPARSHQRAVYRRRRVLAALVGLGLVLAVVRAGVTLGGASFATSERLPHAQSVVAHPGDSLWSLARRAAPGHDARPIVDAMERQLGTDTITAGQLVTVPTP